MPGLIRGAHLNYGLGFAFLRHVERCACLLYVLDLSVENPLEQLEDLRDELNQYEEGLADKPHAIVANKVDLPSSDVKLKDLQEQVTLPVYAISAKKLMNIHVLLRHIREMYDYHRAKE